MEYRIAHTNKIITMPLLHAALLSATALAISCLTANAALADPDTETEGLVNPVLLELQAK